MFKKIFNSKKEHQAPIIYRVLARGNKLLLNCNTSLSMDHQPSADEFKLTYNNNDLEVLSVYLQEFIHEQHSSVVIATNREWQVNEIVKIRYTPKFQGLQTADDRVLKAFEQSYTLEQNTQQYAKFHTINVNAGASETIGKNLDANTKVQVEPVKPAADTQTAPVQEDAKSLATAAETISITDNVAALSATADESSQQVTDTPAFNQRAQSQIASQQPEIEQSSTEQEHDDIPANVAAAPMLDTGAVSSVTSKSIPAAEHALQQPSQLEVSIKDPAQAAETAAPACASTTHTRVQHTQGQHEQAQDELTPPSQEQVAPTEVAPSNKTIGLTHEDNEHLNLATAASVTPRKEQSHKAAINPEHTSHQQQQLSAEHNASTHNDLEATALNSAAHNKYEKELQPVESQEEGDIQPPQVNPPDTQQAKDKQITLNREPKRLIVTGIDGLDWRQQPHLSDFEVSLNMLEMIKPSSVFVTKKSLHGAAMLVISFAKELPANADVYLKYTNSLRSLKHTQKGSRIAAFTIAAGRLEAVSSHTDQFISGDNIDSLTAITGNTKNTSKRRASKKVRKNAFKRIFKKS